MLERSHEVPAESQLGSNGVEGGVSLERAGRIEGAMPAARFESDRVEEQERQMQQDP